MLSILKRVSVSCHTIYFTFQNEVEICIHAAIFTNSFDGDKMICPHTNSRDELGARRGPVCELLRCAHKHQGG